MKKSQINLLAPLCLTAAAFVAVPFAYLTGIHYAPSADAVFVALPQGRMSMTDQGDGYALSASDGQTTFSHDVSFDSENGISLVENGALSWRAPHVQVELDGDVLTVRRTQDAPFLAHAVEKELGCKTARDCDETTRFVLFGEPVAATRKVTEPAHFEAITRLENQLRGAGEELAENAQESYAATMDSIAGLPMEEVNHLIQTQLGPLVQPDKALTPNLIQNGVFASSDLNAWTYTIRSADELVVLSCLQGAGMNDKIYTESHTFTDGSAYKVTVEQGAYAQLFQSNVKDGLSVTAATDYDYEDKKTESLIRITKDIDQVEGASVGASLIARPAYKGAEMASLGKRLVQRARQIEALFMGQAVKDAFGFDKNGKLLCPENVEPLRGIERMGLSGLAQMIRRTLGIKVG